MRRIFLHFAATILVAWMGTGCAAGGGGFPSGGPLGPNPDIPGEGSSHHERSWSQVGLASYYGAEFHGSSTATGRSYDERELTAAHRSLPFGTRVRVTNISSGRSVVVTITDRGPFVRGRIIDVSWKAARELGFLRSGLAKVRVETL
jgi:rare lipoprotein A